MSYTKNQGFVLFNNYIEVFINRDFNKAITVSVYYMLAAVVQVTVSLLLSLILSKCRFHTIYKMIFVLPYMINGIAIGYIFKMFYSHGYVLDSILSFFGANVDMLPYWLRDQDINNWALAFSSVWRYSGLSLVVFLGAIGSIEHSLFEASSLDGANRMKQIKYIVWPSIQRVFNLTLILSIVTSLSEFELPYAIASGGANGTATYMTLIYHIAFTERKIGLASAMAVVLLIQLTLFTSILLSIANTFRDE